jgi:hypothetical protein
MSRKNNIIMSRKSKDYDTYDDEDEEVNSHNGDDFPSMLITLLKNVHWRVALFLFIACIMIFSNVFVEVILANFKNAVDADCPNSKGTFIQLLFVIVAYITIDLLATGEII